LTGTKAIRHYRQQLSNYKAENKMPGKSATVLLPVLLGTSFAYSAHAVCPFGSDCKPQPCGVASETAAVTGYEPRYAPAYGSAVAFGSAYQGGATGSPFSAGSTYSQPPCDPTVVPEQEKPLAVPLPEPEPELNSTDDEEAALDQAS
jgi:hypothetical protein